MTITGFSDLNLPDSSSTFSGRVLANAMANPKKTACIQLNKAGEEIVHFTYSELISNSLNISKQLNKQFKKRDHCLIAIPGGVEFVVAFLGCLFAGIVAVPVIAPKRNSKNQRFFSILRDAEPVCVLTTNEFHDLVQSQINSQPNLKDSLSVINVALNEYVDYQNDLPDHSPNDIAFLQYTSGSIGQPKGINVSHQNLLHNAEIIKQSFNHTPDLVGVSWLPPFHDMGLIGSILQPLYMGGSFVMIQPIDFIRNPALWFETIAKYKGVTVGCPNFALDYCVEKITSPDPETMDLSSIKVLFCGSEPVREHSLRRFTDKFSVLNFKSEMFLPCYGLAEATLMVSGIGQKDSPHFFHADRHALETNATAEFTQDDNSFLSYTSCGHTWNNTDLIIVNPETKKELPENKVGEIWVKSQSICNGYLNKPAETRKVFNAWTSKTGKGPYLRTGDLGFLHARSLYVTGRMKELLIVRGSNIFPNDVENVVDKCHPALMPNSCAVFSIDHEQGEKVVVVQEIKRTFMHDGDCEEIIRHIHAAVAEDFEISLHAIVIINPMSLPKTSSGKIKRLECKSLFLTNKLNAFYHWEEKMTNFVDNTQNVESRPDVESMVLWLKNWLGNKLNINPEEIESDQPILSVGLDSIGAVELENDINNTFDADVFVGDFFENNSIECIAEEVLNSSKASAFEQKK